MEEEVVDLRVDDANDRRRTMSLVLEDCFDCWRIIEIRLQ